MNYLAHIYLSGDNKKLTIGNFIADGIKGKKYLKYPKAVQAGIILHREIDTFTDAHAIVKQSTKRLHENYGHYSGIIVDIIYDHFLAKNWSSYSPQPLATFVHSFYADLQNHFDILPSYSKRMIPYMIADNWLLNYANLAGIERVLIGMNRRTKYKSNMNKAIVELNTFYTQFEDEFTAFFKEIILFASNKRIELSNTLLKT